MQVGGASSRSTAARLLPGARCPYTSTVKRLTSAEVGRDLAGWHKHTPSHLHTEFVEDGHLIHIDVVAALMSGPLRGYWEARIFIDGALAGRGGFGGAAMGCGGNDLPAVARVGNGALVAVADGRQDWPREWDAASQRPVVTLHRIEAVAAGPSAPSDVVAEKEARR
jgi:hypothetical protein